MARKYIRRRGGPRTAVRIATAVSAGLAALASPAAAAAPPIRTSVANAVPGCVTPGRLMAFLAERNPGLAPRFRNIADWYKYYGDGWRVRWDYAFFQMAVETNFLTFRRGDGRPGDVRETQNNFAGIGATGGGAPGERFRDVATGVHAQIQHLVAYSGEKLADPIAARTRKKQDDIVEASRRLGRPVTFADLARRWAVDREYGKSIDFVAGLYQARYCSPERAAEPSRKLPFAKPYGLGGPKPAEPDKLAGPEPAESDASAAGEVLPWLAKPAPSPGPTVSAKPAKAKKKAAKPDGRVKTLWSRDERGPAGNAWADNTVVHRTERGTLPPDRSGPIADDPGEAPTLPTFRIAPVASAPPRLRGPLPGD